MPHLIETIYARDFGFADVQPPIQATFADAGTQAVEHSLYEASLSAGLTEEQADAAKNQLVEALEGDVSREQGRVIIEETFRQVGNYALKWLQ